MKSGSALHATAHSSEIPLIQALKECRRTKDLIRGRKLHKEAAEIGVTVNNFVASSLVSMYASCNSLADAQSIFDRMNFRDVVCWNSLLFGYVENGKGEEAFQLFIAMQRFPSPRPNILTFIGAIKACSILAKNEVARQIGGKLVKVQTLLQGKRVHSEALHELQIKKCLESDRKHTLLACSLVDMYSKCGSLTDAQVVFDSVPNQQVDEVLLTALSLGYADNGDGRSSLSLFIRITHRTRFPGERAYVAALKSCSTLAEQENGRKMKYLEIGMTIHRLDADTTRYSVRDTFVGNALIDMYSKCGSVLDAEKVFHAMQLPDVVSWNTLMMGYILNGKSRLALHLYVLMQTQCLLFPVDVLTVVAAVKACSSLAEEEDSLGGLKMVSLEIGIALHSQALRAGCQSNSFVESSLLDMYSKCGSLVDVRRLFDRIRSPNTITWNVLLAAFANNGEEEEALELFQIMTYTGCVPDSRSYVAVLKACAALAEKEDGRALMNDDESVTVVKVLSLERGMAIHRELSAASCCDGYIESSLVDMYSKSGAVHEAYRVFRGMRTRDAVAWTSFLLGQVGNDESEEALRLFLEECDIKTNVWILVAAIKACGNAIALETGKDLHGQLCRYGFEDVPAAITCLVDFYGKTGSLSKALLVFHSATLCEKKDMLTWAALIYGYSRVGDFHGAVRSFYTMVDEGRLVPNAVMFMEILTVCSHAGFVSHGRRLFEAMQRFGVHQGPEHYQCMVDLLTRANHLDEAIALLERMPFDATVLNWMTVLSSCYRWRNVRVAKRAFEEVMLLDKNQETAYVLMSNICRAD